MIRNLITTSRNGEVLDVLDGIVNAYNASSLTKDPYLVAIFAELQPKSTLMVAAINRSKAESQRDQADSVRDNKIRALWFGVQSALYNDDSAIKTAAVKVNTILDKYGMGIVDEAYALESSLVKSLLADLADPSLADSVAAIPGCAGNIAQLSAAQDAFTAASDAFAADKSTDKEQKTASELKKEIIDLINLSLVRYLNGMQAVNNAEYGALANNIAQLIADNNSLVNRRGASANSGTPIASE